MVSGGGTVGDVDATGLSLLVLFGWNSSSYTNVGYGTMAATVELVVGSEPQVATEVRGTRKSVELKSLECRLRSSHET